HVDFTMEVERSLRVLDGAVAVFDGVAGVEPQSETVWRQADKYGVPRICFINKLDRAGASFDRSFQSILGRLGAYPVALQIPIGLEDQFKGIVDLITMKGLIWNDESKGAEYETVEIPEVLRERAQEMRHKLLEAAAEVDETLTERYLEDEGASFTDEQIRAALRKGTIEIKLVPVVTGSAFKNKGVQTLLDAVVDYLPSPLDIPPIEGTNPKTGEVEARPPDAAAPFAGLVFKIMADKHLGQLSFVRIAVEPKTRADQDKLGTALSRLAQEDPSFNVSTDQETGQTIIAGMGELHLEIIVDRMKREFGVEANVGKPQVAYRETITQAAPGKEVFKKQTGGRGQYAHVELEIEPAPGEGFVFESEIKGGAIPREFIKPTEQGVHDAMERGYLAGYDLVDIKVRLVDGGFHEVDSDERAFIIAGSLAFQDAVRKAKPVLLEPIMRIEVVTPDDYVGAVNGDLMKRRGQFAGTEMRPGGAQV